MPRDAARRAATPFAVIAAAVLSVAGCGGGGDDGEARPTTGAGLYRAFCATCHGADGQGGVGPELAGVVEERYPDIADQIDLVTNGLNRMPAFRGNLSPEEIRRVVEYERTELGR